MERKPPLETLISENNVKLMKSITKIQAGGFYIIQSKASANSNYFESDSLASIFFKYFNYYLKDYIDLYEYSLNQDGWIMAIRIKSASTIKKHYSKILENRSNKDHSSVLEIWRIISERFRVFISTYVRMSNRVLGREGGLVKHKYERFSFDSEEEALVYLNALINQEIEICQPKKEYQGNEQQSCLKRSRKSKKLLRSSYKLRKLRKSGKFKEIIRKFFGCKMPVIKGSSALVVLNSKLYDPSKKITLSHPPSHSKYPD